MPDHEDVYKRQVLTVTENGKGRRSDIDTYRITARGGKGIRNYCLLYTSRCV